VYVALIRGKIPLLRSTWCDSVSDLATAAFQWPGAGGGDMIHDLERTHYAQSVAPLAMMSETKARRSLGAAAAA